MASSKEFLQFVLDQLSDLPDVTYRAMMGEYVLYYRGTVVGGIYDDRFLLKATESARSLMPDGRMELPYQGGKMMLVADIDDREEIRRVIEAIESDLFRTKKEKSKRIK